MSPRGSYLFYDLETSGLSKAFDQVLQFAGIRTDFDFNPIETHSFDVQLNPDTLPHPAAMMTHGIDLARLASGITEYEAMCRIHALLNTPGTISLGYNTLGFDDEFLRFGFYRNLLTPYTHQHTNGCHRMDVYPIAVCYHLFANESMQWHQDRPNSLKLEDLAQANGWQCGEAHDALNDVRMTIALTKHLAQSQPAMWQYLAGYYQKTTAAERWQQLPTTILDGRPHAEGLLIQGRLGHAQAFMCPVIALGQHQLYRNQSCWLRLDHAPLKACKANDVADHVWNIGIKQGEPPFVLPRKRRYLSHLTPERLALAEDNLAFLQSHPRIWRSVVQHATHFEYPHVADVDAHARLYVDGFWPNALSAQAKAFHQLSWQQRSQWLETLPPGTPQELTRRLIGRCRPEVLGDNHQTRFMHYLQSCWSNDHKLHDHTGQARAYNQALLEAIQTLTKTKGTTNTLDSLKHLLETHAV